MAMHVRGCIGCYENKNGDQPKSSFNVTLVDVVAEIESEVVVACYSLSTMPFPVDTVRRLSARKKHLFASKGQVNRARALLAARRSRNSRGDATTSEDARTLPISEVISGRRIVEPVVLADNLNAGRLKCQEELSLKNVSGEKQRGFAHLWYITCSACGHITIIPTNCPCSLRLSSLTRPFLFLVLKITLCTAI